jgi:hypothetical protein
MHILHEHHIRTNPCHGFDVVDYDIFPPKIYVRANVYQDKCDSNMCLTSKTDSSESPNQKTVECSSLLNYVCSSNEI